MKRITLCEEVLTIRLRFVHFFGALGLFHYSTPTFAIECDISKTISHRLTKFGQPVQLDESCRRHLKWSIHL
jgi:hypothetical protein